MAVLRAVVMASVGIILAMEGFAYMTFAWAQVLAWLATAIGFNILLWRPEAYALRFKGIGEVLKFGGHMMGIGGVNALNQRLSEMSLGSIVGLAGLGYYTRASSLPAQLYNNVYAAGSSVIFSRLSQDLRESGDFHENYLRFMRLILGLLWPMMFGLAILAQPVIHLLYGPKWQATATLLSLLTCASAILVAVGMSNEVFILRRETQRQLKIESVRSVLGIGLFVGGAMISLTMAAAAKVAEALIAFILYYKPMVRLVGAPGSALPRVYVESAIVTLPAILPALVLMISSNWSPTTSLPLALSAILAGILGWGGALWWRDHPIAAEALRFIRTRRTGN
jgi:O-antigen/teichoic acid export membrane protein